MDNRNELEANGEDLNSLERRFQIQEEEVRLVNARRGALLAVIFVMGGLVMDHFVYPKIFTEFLILRLACCGLLLGVLALLYLPAMKGYTRLLIHMIALLPMLTLHWMLVQIEVNLGTVDRLSGDGPYYAGLNLNMVGAVLILRWRFSDGVINALLCIGGYLAVASAMDFYHMNTLSSVFFLIVTGIFACAGLFFYNRLRFAEFCLREEVVAQQAELEENHRKLQELDETKTRFFANISHELRTPLTLILAPIEKMNSMNAVRNDAQLSELVESLEDNGMRLLRLINDLLDLVRLDSGEMPIRSERFTPFNFIDGLGRNLHPMAERKRINLSWSATCEEDREVFLDRDRLEKVVLNLAVNALKFTPVSGRVSLKVGIENEHLTLEVADNGAGMHEAQVTSAFERFWQADTSAAKKHRGVGIGLALVKSLTESMDGTVEIESEFGKGTTFTIAVPLLELPAAKEEPEPEPVVDEMMKIHDAARIQGALGRSEHQTSPLDPAAPGGFPIDGSAKRELVLVAEDESGLRRFLKGELEEMGCAVIEACDGAEAWELARQFQPQLVILDYMMPEIDGITLTQRLRHNDLTSQVPILLVTAAADETPRIQALEAGVSDFLTKPFTTAELRLRIRNLLDRQKYQRELGVKNQELSVALEERDEALAEIKENEARLLQAETLSSLGRMSAGIVHEVNNPMNYVKTALHTLRMYTEDVTEEERADFEETIDDAEEGVNRVIRIVSDLRSFTKGEVAMKEEVKLVDTIESARRLLAGDLQNIEFHVNVPEEHKVSGNSNQLCQVFVNIIQNSSQALEGASERGVTARVDIQSEILDDGKVRVRVRDNGSGIEEEDRDHIFDPFFTKRDVGAGMGLGLSICHRILESHEGRIEVESEPGQFTEFSITLPPPWKSEDDDDDDDDDNDYLGAVFDLEPDSDSSTTQLEEEASHNESTIT